MWSPQVDFIGCCTAGPTFVMLCGIEIALVLVGTYPGAPDDDPWHATTPSSGNAEPDTMEKNRLLDPIS